MVGGQEGRRLGACRVCGWMGVRRCVGTQMWVAVRTTLATEHQANDDYTNEMAGIISPIDKKSDVSQGRLAPAGHCDDNSAPIARTHKGRCDNITVALH